MDKEITQLENTGTWKLTELPADCKPIKCKWVLKVKWDHTGAITHYKGHLVTKGFSQIPGIDFTETFAPVVWLQTFQTLIAIVACYKLDIHTMDVVGAYLNSKLNETIYIEQPLGYEDRTNHVYRLHCPLYGLKQSGAIWNKKLNSEFISLGFTWLIADQCVYIQQNTDGIVIVAIHVDNMTILASSNTLMSQVKSDLNLNSDTQDLGLVKQILGMEITWDKTTGSITIT